MADDESTLELVIGFFRQNPTANALVACAEDIPIPWKVAARLEPVARQRILAERMASGELSRRQVRRLKAKELRARAAELRSRAAKLEEEAAAELGDDR